MHPCSAVCLILGFIHSLPPAQQEVLDLGTPHPTPSTSTPPHGTHALLCTPGSWWAPFCLPYSFLCPSCISFSLVFFAFLLIHKYFLTESALCRVQWEIGGAQRLSAVNKQGQSLAIRELMVQLLCRFNEHKRTQWIEINFLKKTNEFEIRAS